MGATAELSAIQARKKLILAQSEVYRATLALECARIDEAVGWLDRGIGFARKTYPLLVMLVPLTGCFLVARRSVFRSVWMKARLGWQVYRKAWPVLKTWFAEK